MNNPFIKRIRFSSTDYDEFASMLKNANIEEKIMERGKFEAEINLVFSQHIFISNFNINKKVLQEGTGTPGYITFVIWNPDSFFNWRKHEMNRGTLGVLWKNEHISITGTDFNGLPVSIQEEFFKNYCKSKGYPELIDKLEKNELLSVSEQYLIEIRRLVYLITHKEQCKDNIVHELIETILLDLLFNCILSAFPEEKQFDLTYLKFTNAVDYIHENLVDIRSVTEVCEQTKIPERTLRRLFQKKYNLSPKAYLNNLRLNYVRRNLKNTNEISNITKIASEYNFWHMGQFAIDYEKLFGELPSITLTKRKLL